MANLNTMKLNILYAEDNILCATNIKHKLEAQGWNVIVAKDGYEAWDIFRQTPLDQMFDAIILDNEMPGLTGVEVAQRILSVNLQVPLIFYSEYDDIEHITKSYHNGAKTYIIKSGSTEQLIATIASVARKNNSQICLLKSNVAFDTLSHILYIGANQHELKPLEGKFFSVLAKNPNCLVSKQQLLVIGWGDDDIRWEKQLPKVILQLRKLLKAIDGIEIKTDTTYGYKLIINNIP